MPLVVGQELLKGLAVAVGWGEELGVADGGAVASQVDGIHDCEGAAYAEAKAQKKAEDCGPVYVHYDWSLSSSAVKPDGSVMRALQWVVAVGLSVGSMGLAQDVSGVVGKELPGLVTTYKGLHA